MEGQGFPQAGRAAPRDFPRASPSGNDGVPPLLLGLTQSVERFFVFLLQ